jgi:hypothetical protein
MDQKSIIQLHKDCSVALIELFKDLKFLNLSLDLIIEKKNDWGKILFNNNFINYHLLEEEIKPILTNVFSSKLLDELRLSNT